MTTPAFESWWDRFQRSVDDPADSKQTALTLRRHWLGLPQRDRRPFLGWVLERLLQQRREYGVALFMLEAITDPEYLEEFARHLGPLPGLQSEDEESHLADLMRILCAANEAVLAPPIGEYLLVRPIGSCWSSVPWALWPHDKDLFGRAWSRFFVEHDVRNGIHRAVLRSFLTEPEAIGVVRRFLSDCAAERWDVLREELLGQAASAPWLTPRQRKALERATR